MTDKSDAKSLCVEKDKPSSFSTAGPLTQTKVNAVRAWKWVARNLLSKWRVSLEITRLYPDSKVVLSDAVGDSRYTAPALQAKALVLKPCPFCGNETPEIVDDRLQFFVRCNECKPFATVIYGDSYRYIDGLEDAEAQQASEAIDWDAAKQSAVDAWNRRSLLPAPQPHLTRLIEAARDVFSSASDTYRKRNGHLGSFEDESGEKCWIVPFDAFESLRSALSATERLADAAKPCGIPDPSTRDCPNMKEVGGGMDGERYRCAVCGKGYFLDYEDMK